MCGNQIQVYTLGNNKKYLLAEKVIREANTTVIYMDIII